MAKKRVIFLLICLQYLLNIRIAAQIERYTIEGEQRDFRVKINKSVSDFIVSFIFLHDSTEEPIGISELK